MNNINIKIKKKLNQKSPLSLKYKTFLNGGNINQNLNPKKLSSSEKNKKIQGRKRNSNKINIIKLNKSNQKNKKIQGGKRNSNQKNQNKSNQKNQSNQNKSNQSNQNKSNQKNQSNPKKKLEKEINEKRSQLRSLIKQISKEKLIQLIQNKIFGNDNYKKLYILNQFPEKYFTIEELLKINKNLNKNSRKKGNVKQKRKSKRVSRSRKRNKLNKKHLKNRSISFKCQSRKNKNINKILNNIKNSSQNNLKKELEKKGIHLKSNNKQLINDMYLFSSLGGITIKND